MSMSKMDISAFEGFGRRLMELARDKDIGSPSEIAEALYGDYYEYVNPAQRKNKKGKVVKDRYHDVEAIKRMVQKHLNERNAYNIQSKYIYAYSELFNCSADYLYGRTTVRSCNLEKQDICNKLHISQAAAENLIENYDDDLSVFSLTRCWSDILSSNLFEDAPYEWLKYNMIFLRYRDLEKKIKALKRAETRAKLDEDKLEIEFRRNELEKLLPGEKAKCDGAYEMLLQILTSYIDSKSLEWQNSQHREYEDNYYDNELKKIKVLEMILQEGACGHNDKSYV